MKKLSMAVAVSSIALVTPGLAAADTFNYASVKGGWAQVRDTHFDLGVDGGIDTRVETNYDDGFVGGIAVGRQYDTGRSFNVRTEVEIGYQMADVNRHKVVNTDVSDPNVSSPAGSRNEENSAGDFSTLYAFASVYGERDLDILPELSFIFGAGAGLGLVEFDGYGTGGPDLMDDSDVGHGFHLTTGWSYDLGDQVALEATYRYMSIEDIGFEAETENGKSTRQRIDSHNFMAGVRFGF